MARATVQLVGCLSHTYRNRTMRKGDTVVITNQAEIDAYTSMSEYAVEVHDDEPKAKAKAAPAPKAKEPAAPKAKAKAKEPEPEPEDDDDEDESDDDDSEDESTDEDESDDDEDDDSEEDAADIAKDDVVYTTTQLNEMNKAKLQELYAFQFEKELDPELKKSQMIAEILRAQIAREKSKK